MILVSPGPQNCVTKLCHKGSVTVTNGRQPCELVQNSFEENTETKNKHVTYVKCPIRSKTSVQHGSGN